MQGLAPTYPMIPHTGRSVYVLPADLLGDGQFAFHDRDQFGCNRCALVGVAGLDHHTHQRLCARGTQHDPPIASERRLSGRDGGPERLAIIQTLA